MEEEQKDLKKIIKNWNSSDIIEIVCFVVGIAVLIWLGV